MLLPQLEAPPPVTMATLTGPGPSSPLVPQLGRSVQRTPWMEALGSGMPSVTVPEAVHHLAHLAHMEACVWRQSPAFGTPESSFQGFVIHSPGPQKQSSLHAETGPEPRVSPVGFGAGREGLILPSSSPWSGRPLSRPTLRG